MKKQPTSEKKIFANLKTNKDFISKTYSSYNSITTTTIK